MTKDKKEEAKPEKAGDGPDAKEGKEGEEERKEEKAEEEEKKEGKKKEGEKKGEKKKGKKEKEEEVEEDEPEDTTSSSDTKPAPKKRGKGKAIAAVIVVVMLVTCGVGFYWFFYMQPAKKAPDFTLTDTDGNEFHLSSFQGKKVVVLDFMFTTCSGCKQVEKNLRVLYDRYNDTDEVEILSVSSAFGVDNTARLKLYKEGGIPELSPEPIPWRLAMDDPNDMIQMKYGITEYPTVVVIDKDGYAIFKKFATATETITYVEMKDAVDAGMKGTGQRVSIIELSIYGVAILTGVASFFSPCAFPMLPGYMTYYLQKRVESQKKGKGKGKDGNGKDEAEPESDKATVMKAAKSGSVTAAGLLVVYFVTGALVVFLGSTVSNKIGYMQLIVGIILIALGGLMFSNLQYYRLVVPIQNAFAKLRKGGGAGTGEESGYYGGLFAYGAGYGAAAAGCTLPAFVAVIFGAMVSGSIWMGLIVVFLYSIVAAMLMIGVTVGIAYFGQGAVQKLAAHTETIKKVSAAVLILVGVYLILYFLDSKGYISIFGNLGM